MARLTAQRLLVDCPVHRLGARFGSAPVFQFSHSFAEPGTSGCPPYSGPGGGGGSLGAAATVVQVSPEFGVAVVRQRCRTAPQAQRFS
jgi:hypothetical protein